MRYRLWRFSTLVAGLVFMMPPASVSFKAGGSKEDARERGDQKNPKTTQPPGAEKGSAPEIRNDATNPAPLKPVVSPATAAQNTALKPPGVTSPATPPVSKLLDEPLPVSVRDHVNGNQYINDTFQFAMFKPPGWKIYEGVPKETGSGIVAIGTEDEQTLLIVDRQVWSGAPDLKNDRTEERLRQNYQEFHKFLEFSAQLDGYPVTRRAFKGVLDGVEWHGVSVHLARGNTVFGIIGLTSAETYQFQQAVLNKVINSFHFLTPSAPAVSPPQASAGP
jgi:hypothetical protein